jgi:hypothetical protein
MGTGRALPLVVPMDHQHLKLIQRQQAAPEIINVYCSVLNQQVQLHPMQWPWKWTK